MKLSVIIPAYNEEKTIEALIRKVKQVPLEKEIIIVDDGSTDGTRELLDKLKREHDFKLVKHGKNQGKGAAIRTGLREVEGEVVIIQDADLEYDPNDYLKLVEPIKNNQTSVVYGSRNLTDNKKSKASFYWGGVFLSWLTNFLYGTKITDEPTCYKMFKSSLIKSIDLKCERFEFCPEVTAKIAKAGQEITEIPINYYPRSKKEGKKIKWRDGAEAAWVLIKYRFVK